MHLQLCMKSIKALGVACLSAVIGWSGFTIADKVYKKCPVGSHVSPQAAALTFASATNMKPGFAELRGFVPELIVPVPGLA